MKKLISALVIGLSVINLFSQTIPEGYLLQYHQDFSNKKSIQDFRFSISGTASIRSEKGKYFLEITAHHDTMIPSYQPSTICLLDNLIFGDYILEANVMYNEGTDKNALWFLTAIKDSLNYYCLDISPIPGNEDTLTYALLRGKPRKIQIAMHKLVSLQPDKWYKVKMIRDIVNPSVKIFMDDMKNPVLEINDRTFIMGYIGFGMNNGIFRIANIKIWSQTSIPEPAGFYGK